MREALEALVGQGRLTAVAEGYEPAEGVELTVVVDTGSSAISLDEVTQIITTSDTWLVCRKADEEVIWIRPESIVILRSRGGEEKAGKGRTGFG